jgi:hypothetical protein
MCFGPSGLREALVEKGENRVLTDERITVLADERGDRVAPCSKPQFGAFVASNRDLPKEIGHVELGQTLAHSTRGRTPLRLEQL